MQTLDSTILATSLPAMARALDQSPVRLHLAITSYILSLAGFLPLSSWLVDRFGARRVFRAAIAIFTLASILCGFAQDLNTLLLFRALQGMGGAMMTPVGRLILVRSFTKTEIIGAMTLMSMPGLVGPIVGPPLGGLITELLSWRWIFWVNLPIGLAGFILVGVFIDDVRDTIERPFDFRGFVLSGLGLAATFFGFDTAATQALPAPVSISILAFGIPLIVAYVFHARRSPNPILDLTIMRAPALRASVVGGSLFRVGLGALPFMLPLLLQEGLGYSPLQSGLITFASSAGAFGMRGFTTSVLRRFGFRTVLTWISVAAGLFMASYGTFRPATPVVVMLVLLAFGGIFRSLSFGSLNALAFADVEASKMSQATGLVFMAQRLSQTMGVALSAFILHVASNGDSVPIGAFSIAFVAIAVLSSLSAIVFYRLDPDIGSGLSGQAEEGRNPSGNSRATGVGPRLLLRRPAEWEKPKATPRSGARRRSGKALRSAARSGPTAQQSGPIARRPRGSSDQ